MPCVRKEERSRQCRLLLVAVCCASSSPAADALIAPGKAFPLRAALPRIHTKLETARDDNAEGDFASFSDFGREEDDGRELAREFYRELQNRQSSSSSGSSPASGNDDRGGIVAASSAASGRSRKLFATPTTSSSDAAGPFPFLSFLAPQPRPAASAGLFSGSGTTVYSSGRSVRAEIEILETTMKNNDAGNKNLWDSFYVGSPEQAEEVLKLLALSLIVLSAAYVAVEASGGMEKMAVISWDEVGASANDALSLMTDATREGVDGMLSGILVSAGHGDVFLGEEAARLMKESAEWAASVGEAVRSVEDLVLC